MSVELSTLSHSWCKCPGCRGKNRSTIQKAVLDTRHHL